MAWGEETAKKLLVGYDPEGMVKGCLYLLNQTKPQYVLSILHMIATTIPFN